MKVKMTQILNIFKMKDDVSDVKYSTENSACFDISAFIQYQTSVKLYTKDNKLVESLAANDADMKGNYIIIPGEWRCLVPTGLILDIPEDHCVKIYPRSGLSTKKGLNLINCVGIIDSDYVEQLYIPIYNNSQERIKIYNGDRIAQGELAYQPQISINYINERPQRKSDRDGGFGSTGV